jgi:thioredoxin 1
MMKEAIRMGEQYDDELERIRMEKLKDLIDRQQSNTQSEMGQHWPYTPITVSDTTFADIIKKYPLVVIDCYAQWCGPCHMVAPVIEELARDYTGKIVFGKLDTDENRISASMYNIMSIPTLLVFKNGKLVDQLMGAMPREMLEPMITKHL